MCLFYIYILVISLIKWTFAMMLSCYMSFNKVRLVKLWSCMYIPWLTDAVYHTMNISFSNGWLVFLSVHIICKRQPSWKKKTWIFIHTVFISSYFHAAEIGTGVLGNSTCLSVCAWELQVDFIWKCLYLYFFLSHLHAHTHIHPWWKAGGIFTVCQHQHQNGDLEIKQEINPSDWTSVLRPRFSLFSHGLPDMRHLLLRSVDLGQ